MACREVEDLYRVLTDDFSCDVSLHVIEAQSVVQQSAQVIRSFSGGPI
jgi:hypothetical protein